MKPFDPKTAKYGDKVISKANGNEYVYIGPNPCYDGYSAIALISTHWIDSVKTDSLVIPPTKRTVWINVYKTGKALWWNSKEDALLFTEKDNLIGTYPLEIEE